MNKIQSLCLIAVLLLSGAIAGVMFLSSGVRAQGDGIIVDGADDKSIITNEHSAELANATTEVTSRVVAEYGDFGSSLELIESGELDQAASTVSSKATVEYADFTSNYASQSSYALQQAAADVTSRIIVEYADFIFGPSLGPNPMEIIPEFQSPIILSLLMILSTLTLAFAKCTHSSWRREKQAR